jgi:hypothetical protein
MVALVRRTTLDSNIGLFRTRKGSIPIPRIPFRMASYFLLSFVPARRCAGLAVLAMNRQD